MSTISDFIKDLSDFSSTHFLELSCFTLLGSLIISPLSGGMFFCDPFLNVFVCNFIILLSHVPSAFINNFLKDSIIDDNSSNLMIKAYSVIQCLFEMLQMCFWAWAFGSVGLNALSSCGLGVHCALAIGLISLMMGLLISGVLAIGSAIDQLFVGDEQQVNVLVPANV